MIADRLRRWLQEPLVRSLDVDDAEFSLAHREVLRRKPMVRSLFRFFYEECRAADRRFFGNAAGMRLEIGSGSSVFQEVDPGVRASDIQCLPGVDLVFRAEEIPLRSASVRAIYGINVFHHLDRPRGFFREAARVLAPGGGVVFVEPFHGWLARLLFRRLHASEGFDPEAASWEKPASGPFSSANQALSFVVFERDREAFEEDFPELEIVSDRPHTHLRYLLSGGVNFRQLVPGACAGAVERSERLLSPLDRWLALQHTIVLRKSLISPGARRPRCRADR